MNYDKYKDLKRVIFYEFPDQHARFLIQLHYDGLRQREFLRAILEGYVEGDKNIFDFVQNYKLEKGKPKTLANKVKKNRAKAHELERRFGLNEEEIEDIFDILEEEYIKL